MGSPDELVDEVDADDRVLRTVTRAEMRSRRLRHRSVFVVVQSSTDEVLVHRRAEHKDVWPGRWDLAAGGVVSSGESYDDAAVRELAEELGIVDVPVERLGRGSYDDADVSEVTVVYRVRWDGRIRFADGEVIEVRWMTLADLQRAAGRRPGSIGGRPSTAGSGGAESALTALDFVPDSVALALPLL